MTTLLIIDDDDATIYSLRRLFEFEGHTVQTARDGFEGMRRVIAAAPDAILLDVRMPIANGLVFLRALRGNPRYARIPVAVITGDYFLEPDVADELAALGAAIYFKPMWFKGLVEIVERLLAQTDRAH